MERDILLTALCGEPTPSVSVGETADQQVRKRQEGSAKALHDGFARMRRHPDFKRAAEAGEDGHHERNQATTKRLALWAEWERTMLADILSPELANEAKAWYLRLYERGKDDATDPPPKLVLYEGVLNECFKGVFCDANDDAIFRECLHRIIADDVKALMPLIPAETPAPPQDAADEDGPVPPNGFRWRGIIHRPLAKGPYGAIAYLWDCRDHHCDFSDLAEYVCGDREEDMSDTAPRNLREGMNTFFTRHTIPLHAVVKGRVIAVQDGSPRLPRDKAPPKKRPRRR